MKVEQYDVIVVGVGSMGSSAVHELTDRGLKVLGLEAFGLAHDRGSMHGGSRIIRKSYFEGPEYVPLLHSAYAGWRALAEESGRDLLQLCGGVYIGDPNSPVFAGSLASARLHGLDHEVLDAAEIRRRWPTMRPADHALGLFETEAGYVKPEETVLGYVELAQAKGASIRFNEPVTGWSATAGGGVEVTTDQGRYAADRLVLSAGAWADRLVEIPLAVERQIFYWFTPDFTSGPPYAAYASGHPIYVEETDDNEVLYGFPMIDGPDGGLKFAFYRQNHGRLSDPDSIDRTVHTDEIAAMLVRGRQLFPYLTDQVVAARTCIYATAPDDHFMVGALPDTPQVILAAGFSGHGFKFVPIMGQIVADLVQRGATEHDIGLFDVTRFGSSVS